MGVGADGGGAERRRGGECGGILVCAVFGLGVFPF